MVKKKLLQEPLKHQIKLNLTDLICYLKTVKVYVMALTCQYLKVAKVEYR